MRVRLTYEKSRTASMRTWLPLLLVILVLVVAPQAAIAQNTKPRSFSSYVFQNEPPSKLVAAAFAQPYGRAIAAEFSAALAESADPDCLQTKRFTKEQFPDRALAMLQKRGAYMLERADLMTDQARFQSYLRARIGADGMTEVERLRNDPLVRAYLAVDEPARLAYVAVAIVEQIQRYAMISRIKFARPFSPLASDIPAIDKLDPTDKVDGTLKEMVANDKTGTLVRYLELVAMADKPLRDAINMDIAMKTGPGEFLAPPGKDRSDLQNELVELCVARPAVRD